jgi:hypothetical protein
MGGWWRRAERLLFLAKKRSLQMTVGCGESGFPQERAVKGERGDSFRVTSPVARCRKQLWLLLAVPAPTDGQPRRSA